MPRRLALLPLTAGIRSAPVCSKSRHGTHSTYVIVNGAWSGGWDWRAVDSMLTLRGNRVVRVTLTGLGERVHLASPTIGLSTHIDDVVNTILWEYIHDVILVGHRYGGIVISGVVDRLTDRISSLVYLETIIQVTA